MAIPWRDGQAPAKTPYVKPTGPRPAPGQRNAEYQGYYDAVREAMASGMWTPPGSPGAPQSNPNRNILPRPSGGSRGGGGGGGAGGPNMAAMTDAYSKYLAFMQGQKGDWLKDPALVDALSSTTALDDRVNRFRQSGQGAYDNAMGQINRLSDQGNQRLGQIVQALTNRGNQARQDVRGVFDANTQAIQGIANQAQGAVDTVGAQVGASAQGFGFNPAQDVQGVSDMAAALAAQNAARAGAYDAAYADRQNVYGGLQADVSRSILDRQQALGGQASMSLQQLMNQAGSFQLQGAEEARIRGLQEQARQRQGYEQWNADNQKNVYQIMLEAAQQGIGL